MQLSIHPEQFVRYHRILGVELGATDEQIKAAAKPLLSRFHPDRRGNPENEVKFKDIVNARDELSNLDNGETRTLTAFVGKQTLQRRTSRPSTVNDWDFVEKMGAAILEQYLGSGLHNVGGKPEGFLLTDYDLAFVGALKQAYLSDKSGRWYVRRSQDDERHWMKRGLYTIVRTEEGMVEIYRTAKDLFPPEARNHDLVISTPGGESKTHKSDAHISLGAMHETETVNGVAVRMDSGWVSHVKALDYIAKYPPDMRRIQDGSSVGKAVNAIRSYRGSRINSPFDIDPQEVPISEFWNRVNEATREQVVFREGIRSKPEGGPSKPEGGS